MIYVIIRHGEIRHDGGGTSAGHGQQHDATGAQPSQRRWARGVNVMDKYCTHANTQSTQVIPSANKVVKRRARRPTTSVLSDKVWREMRKQIGGRAQHDGVT